MQICPRWHSGTHSCLSSSLLHNFFPSGTVGPASSLVPPYTGTVGPTLPNFPTCKFVPGGAVGPIPTLVLPYFTISSLVAQWDLSHLLFFPSGAVGHESSLVPL